MAEMENMDVAEAEQGPEGEPPQVPRNIRLDVLCLNAVFQSLRAPDPKMDEHGIIPIDIIPEEKNEEKEAFGRFLWPIAKCIIRRGYDASGIKAVDFLGVVAHYGSHHVGYYRKAFKFFSEQVEVLLDCGIIHMRTEKEIGRSDNRSADRFPGAWFMNVVADENVKVQPQRFAKCLSYLESSHKARSPDYSSDVEAVRTIARNFLRCIFNIQTNTYDYLNERDMLSKCHQVYIKELIKQVHYDELLDTIRGNSKFFW